MRRCNLFDLLMQTHMVKVQFHVSGARAQWKCVEVMLTCHTLFAWITIIQGGYHTLLKKIMLANISSDASEGDPAFPVCESVEK